MSDRFARFFLSAEFLAVFLTTALLTLTLLIAAIILVVS
jgi:hypothetical protein